ncbi:unnamed protein product [Linum tenue]|uniref:Uncharacterized protein n=1 Tax=Linum tenue TaxID=586396 RepID=A0AAV0K553_9ROSI|nr:unnamed protein product [Linum tenue]
MNRSFRAQDSQQMQQLQMQAAVVKQRQQLRASMMKEKEEELALFLEMRKREREQNSNLLLLNEAGDFDAPLGSKPGTSPIFNIPSSTPARKTGGDDFLNSDNDKNDYDWLLTPPGTPLFPSLEMESQKTVMSQIGTPKARPTALKSRLANNQPESTAGGNLLSRQSASSPGLNSSTIGIRRPSSSSGPGSRPGTPTGRSTLTTSSKPARSSTPTSRASLPSSKPALRSSSAVAKPTGPPPARSTTASATKPTVPARSSTPTRSTPRSSTPTRSTARSSTPTARPSIPPPQPRPASRPATPTRRPSTPSSAPPGSRSSAPPPPIKSSSASVVTKSVPTLSRNPVPSSRGSSPAPKSRPWKPSDMPGYSLDAPPNLRTSISDRPTSASRGRPGAPASRSSSVEPVANGRIRRQSCSPSRGRAPNGNSGGSVPAGSRLYAKANDSVSPVLMGTKMVERVINMRKLAPPSKQDDNRHSPHGNLSAKSSSPDSSGFGRTLSKKSLDMAIRHMDIRRTIPGNLRPLMTNIPASSMYSVRSSGPPRSGRTISVLDSPLATSSNASSELSVNNGGLSSMELEDDIGGIERHGRSPIRGR